MVHILQFWVCVPYLLISRNHPFSCCGNDDKSTYHIYGPLRQPLLLYSSISQKRKCSEILRHFACRTFKQSHAVLCCAVHVNADKFAVDTRVLWSTKGMAHARVLTWAWTAGCGCQAGQTRCQDNAVRASQCEEVLIKHLHNKLKLPASRERSLRSSLTY